MAVPESYYRNSFSILFPAKGIMTYWQIISICLYVRFKRNYSVASRALWNRWIN